MCPKLMQRALKSEESIYDKSTEQHFWDTLWAMSGSAGHPAAHRRQER